MLDLFFTSFQKCTHSCDNLAVTDTLCHLFWQPGTQDKHWSSLYHFVKRHTCLLSGLANQCCWHRNILGNLGARTSSYRTCPILTTWSPFVHAHRKRRLNLLGTPLTYIFRLGHHIMMPGWMISIFVQAWLVPCVKCVIYEFWVSLAHLSVS